MQVAHGQTIDFVIVIVYFVGILGFGSFFGRHTKTTKDFFFSGQRFSWWLIAFSCVATVVGSYSFIKYSAVGYNYGLSSSMTYLNDWFLLPLFMLGWLPIIYFSRVVSIPEYFERRFDRPTRVMAVIFIMLYMVGYIGINLYTLGVAMHAIVPGIGVFEWAAIISVIAAIYVTFGGQTAVIMTDLIQGILLLGAGILLFYLGIRYLGKEVPGLGGLAAFWEGLPQAHRLPFSGLTTPEQFPMAGIFWQDMFGSSMFFYFANQGLIMRFLAVKSVAEGRKAIMVVALILMPLAMLAVGNAGWLGRAMQSFGLINADVDPNSIFMVVAEIVTRPGVFGLILAALTAALMSTVDTLINAVSAIAVNDVYRPFIAPGRKDSHYLKAARVSSIIFTIAGLALVPIYMRFRSIYVAHGAFTATISPPIIVAVILGILWKRFSPRAAFLTMLGGGLAMGLSIKWPALIKPLADLHGMDPGTGFDYMRALYGFVLCTILAVVGTFVWPARDTERAEGLWIGSVKKAKALFKGAVPNDQVIGKKVRLALQSAPEEEVEDRPTVTMSAEDAGRMAAGDGDLVYVCDRRWWLGGLHSLHGKLQVADLPAGTIAVPANYIKVNRLDVGDQVVVEKIL
ncbi:MAG: sodium:solute symporter family protein [Bradymonadales bacterium]|nr:sodium:solute symporter family protein [Bradymonadales bacterium]